MPALPTGELWYPALTSLPLSSTNVAIASGTDIVSLICELPLTGTITGLSFGTATVGTGATLTGSVETVSNLTPSGTLYHANASASVIVADSDDNVTKTVTFPGSFTATKGDLVAITLRVSSGAPTNLQIRGYTTAASNGFPYRYTYLSGVASRSQNLLSVGFTYTTGSNGALGSLVYDNLTLINISSNSTPDEIGMYFTLPFSGRCDGFAFRTAGNGNFKPSEIVLYDADGTTALRTKTLSQDYFNYNSPIMSYWQTPANLKINRTYRLTIRPTSTTSWTQVAQIFTGVSGAGIDLTARYGYTYRTDAGAWINDNTARAPFALLFQKVHMPGGTYL